MDTATHEDERAFIRHPVDTPIWVRSHEHPGQHTLPTNNISKGGLAFVSHEAIAPGSVIDISIRITRPAFSVRGMVKWCRQAGSGWDIGAQFVNKEDAFRVRMIEQVCHIEQYKQEVVQREGRRLSSEHAAREWIEKHAGQFPGIGPIHAS